MDIVFLNELYVHFFTYAPNDPTTGSYVRPYISFGFLARAAAEQLASLYAKLFFWSGDHFDRRGDYSSSRFASKMYVGISRHQGRKLETRMKNSSQDLLMEKTARKFWKIHHISLFAFLNPA